MKNVLVTAIGSFSADIVIKGLKREGYNVIGCDVYPKEWLVDAYNVSRFYQAPYTTNEDGYINFIKDICIKEDIKFILPLTDVEVDVLNKYRESFEEHNIKICISDKKVIDICRNKEKLEKYLADKNITRTINTKLMSEVNFSDINYPVVCKPFNGRSSQGLRYIYSIEEMENFISTIDVNNYIVQPYIKGNIITVDVVRQAYKNEAVAILRKELLRTQNGAGTSVYVFNDEKLQQECIEIARALNINGCVNFEFIEDEEGNKHFVECNPRFSGGVEFSCIAGYNFVFNHIKCFKGKSIDKLNPYKNQYISRKYTEYITAIEDN